MNAKVKAAIELAEFVCANLNRPIEVAVADRARDAERFEEYTRLACAYAAARDASAPEEVTLHAAIGANTICGLPYLNATDKPRSTWVLSHPEMRSRAIHDALAQGVWSDVDCPACREFLGLSSMPHVQ